MSLRVKPNLQVLILTRKILSGRKPGAQDLPDQLVFTLSGLGAQSRHILSSPCHTDIHKICLSVLESMTNFRLRTHAEKKIRSRIRSLCRVSGCTDLSSLFVLHFVLTLYLFNDNTVCYNTARSVIFWYKLDRTGQLVMCGV